jgi:hypothetical protein
VRGGKTVAAARRDRRLLILCDPGEVNAAVAKIAGPVTSFAAPE